MINFAFIFRAFFLLANTIFFFFFLLCSNISFDCCFLLLHIFCKVLVAVFFTKSLHSIPFSFLIVLQVFLHFLHLHLLFRESFLRFFCLHLLFYKFFVRFLCLCLLFNKFSRYVLCLYSLFYEVFCIVSPRGSHQINLCSLKLYWLNLPVY